MNILKLTGFTAESEVLGTPRSVNYDGSHLRIADLTMTEAHEVLDALATGKLVHFDDDTLVTGKLIGGAGGEEKKKATHDTEVAATDDESPPKPKARPRQPKMPAPLKRVPVANVADDVADVDEDDIPEARVEEANAETEENERIEALRARGLLPPEADAVTDEEDDEEEEAGASAAVPDGTPQRPRKPAGNGSKKVGDVYPLDESVGELPEAITSAVRLRQILAHLIDNGMTDTEKIVDECQRMRAAVPLLNRIGNLRERVVRSLSVMDMG